MFSPHTIVYNSRLLLVMRNERADYHTRAPLGERLASGLRPRVLQDARTVAAGDGEHLLLVNADDLHHRATEGCGGQPTFRLEAGGVGSNYCSGCRQKIELDEVKDFKTWPDDIRRFMGVKVDVEQSGEGK